MARATYDGTPYYYYYYCIHCDYKIREKKNPKHKIITGTRARARNGQLRTEYWRRPDTTTIEWRRRPTCARAEPSGAVYYYDDDDRFAAAAAAVRPDVGERAAARPLATGSVCPLYVAGELQLYDCRYPRIIGAAAAAAVAAS